MHLARSHLVLLLLLLWPFVTRAQPLPDLQEVPTAAQSARSLMDEEVGLPFFFEHFTRQDYRQHHQNWAVAQDPRGVIYVANYDGILEYDGASWRLIETPTKTIVRSLNVSAEGRIYTGAQGDFGYLQPDTSGILYFVSLRDKMAPAHQDFWDVWGTHVTDDGVYFQSADRLFRWDGQAMKVWESEQGFHTSFGVQGQVYVREWGRGLLHLVGDTLTLVAGGAQFADVRVYMMAPYAEDRLLIVTRTAGLYLYDGASMVAFPTDADPLFRQYRFYHGYALPDGRFALAFLDGGGVVIINEQGEIVQQFDESTGLPDGWVNHVFADVQGGLWMALNNDGIVRVDFSSPLSFYDQKLGLKGRINGIQRYQGRLYIATTTGVYVLDTEAGADAENGGHASFKEVLGGTSRVLMAADTVLFVANDDGLFRLRGDQSLLLTEDTEAIFDLLPSTVSDRIYLGREDGIALLEPTATGWKVHPRLEEVDAPVASMAEDRDGTLWVATADRQLLRLRLSDEGAVLSIEQFGETEGLPPGGLWPSPANEEVIFSSENGIFRYGSPEPGRSQARFYLDPALYPSGEVSSDSLLTIFVDKARTFWLIYPDRVEIARQQADGSYAREAPAALRFPKGDVVPIYVEEEGATWIGDGNRLIRYDRHFQKRYDTGFEALVRLVTSGTGQVIFGGTPAQAGALTPALDYVHNDLRFEFAAPSYNAVKENHYQYYLEGRDAGWSDWTYRKSQSYYGLGEGRYRFRVRARNAQGIVSEEAAFDFRILPPWYRTGWAYGLYLMLFIGAVALFWRYRTIVEENKRAQEQVRELARERLVNERLQQANNRLQEANEGLLQVNKLKDEFLATTSHELRTPLTAILGFTAVLQEELSEPYQELLDPIKSNGQRLLHTVNSLLELAKLRAGMMEAHREVLDVGDLAAEVIRMLAPLANQKALPLELLRPPQLLLVHLDRRFLEHILNNLIGNAIKFTEEGHVHVAVEQESDQVFIRISDTGIGIDEAFIPYLFDEFKQESSGLSRSHEGSGLGLSITARLVELMDGAIDVESRKGRGSVFTVSFPLHHPSVEDPAPPEPSPAVMR